MESSSQRTGSRGLWNNPRPTQCSKEAQDMLRLVKNETRLTNLHRKKTSKYPQNIDPSIWTSDFVVSPSTITVQQYPLWTSQKRSLKACQSGNSYVRERFYPGPTRDTEKEKRRLQDILASGKTSTAASVKKPPEGNNAQEVHNQSEADFTEKEERRQVQADMAALGQEKQYINSISSEISQRIRELERMNKINRVK